MLSIPMQFGEDPEFWPRLGAWLRSTRKARLLAREETWKKKEKKQRISPAARAQIAQSVALTSLFDCFWRMRIKSNYGTIDPYLINQTSETDHRIFSEALCTVTRAPVALLELFIIRKIGKPEFAKIATEFVAQDTHNLTARMLRARLAAYGIAL